MQISIGDGEESFHLAAWLGHNLLPFLLPAFVAWLTWASNQWHKANVVRSSYTAQLQSLESTLLAEKEYLRRSGKNFTWFPILPYFQDIKGPLAAAGLLSAAEVNALVAVFFTYREQLTYIARYGETAAEIRGVDNVIGVDISLGTETRAYYEHDLEEIRKALTPAIIALSGRLSGRPWPQVKHWHARGGDRVREGSR